METKTIQNKLWLLCSILMMFLLAGCPIPIDGSSNGSPISVREQSLTKPDPAVPCAERFISRDLNHFTATTGISEVRRFEANGGGVALGDLDNDGDLDIVLANHGGANSIQWNEGELNFRVILLDHGESRAVSVVDVDGDGWLDIVFTRHTTGPTYWHNERGQQFNREVLPGVTKPLYSMDWADLDQDGDLDIVGASYDSALLDDLGQSFIDDEKGGIYHYENREGRFYPTKLADEAQALSLILIDLNNDNLLDILVGNDFDIHDQVWYRKEGGWAKAEPFPNMSRNTMSIEATDIDNDGVLEIFSTDMVPYSTEGYLGDAWKPVIDGLIYNPIPEGDPQVMSNMLQFDLGEWGYQNESEARGINASGWSWSAKFGDLDQDGYVDLYIVNGMIEFTTFRHLSYHELMEENQAYQNDGFGYFEPNRNWNLNSTRSGRGTVMGDLDGDGDLDIVINNLRARAQLYENQLCTGSNMLVDLNWSNTLNRRAIGTRLVLETEDGELYHRRVTANSGYLSGNPSRVHFGFPEEKELKRLEIYWPDGEVTYLEEILPRTVLSVRRKQ